MEERKFDTEIEDRDEYEAEETLSFCDLPLHPNWATTEEEKQSFISLTSSSSYTSSSDDTLFEFFSSDSINYPMSNSSSENILFCGKLIRPKKDDTKKIIAPKPRGPARTRWPLFGSARVPAEMGLGEMRRRVQKSSSVKKTGGRERERKREKRLWGVIKALGCGGSYVAVA